MTRPHPLPLTRRLPRSRHRQPSGPARPAGRADNEKTAIMTVPVNADVWFPPSIIGTAPVGGASKG